MRFSYGFTGSAASTIWFMRDSFTNCPEKNAIDLTTIARAIFGACHCRWLLATAYVFTLSTGTVRISSIGAA